MTTTHSARKPLSVAFIHHANQFLITDGYGDREGISTVAGTRKSATGLTRILELHRRYRVPVNLHFSGTLLEALAWHCPGFFLELKRLAKLDLLELVGSSYGQNMMKFFSPEHNLRQLNEQLLLYKGFLKWDAERVKVFWVPERLWDTDILSPVLTNRKLPNGGYRFVVIDDRLLYSDQGNHGPRRLYDRSQTWDPANFMMYNIQGGSGLCALPIANNLRQNIPPRGADNFERIKAQLRWLFDLNHSYGDELIAVYADDMEKAAGAGWDRKGPAQYESVLQWVSETRWLQAAKVGEWASSRTPAGERPIERGAYVELVNDFEAGETYDKWYYDPRWAPYTAYYQWSESRVQELASKGADAALIELAWKVLLATAWQTAWHTPATGAHGDPSFDRGPSPWARAVASHSRLAAIVAEAAYWMNNKETNAQAYLQDLDHDGDAELVVRNNVIFAVFSPRNGGRLVYLFSVAHSPGRLVVGNPVDDWNLLEELHEYMDMPANHPGAFSDVGYEHDNFVVHIQAPVGDEVNVQLRNSEKDSAAFGTGKSLALKQGENAIRVDYSLPNEITRFSTEVGLSPDYLKLLRHAHRGVREFSPSTSVHGWLNRDVAVWARREGNSTVWDSPRRERFGHGFLLRITSFSQSFTIWLGVDLLN